MKREANGRAVGCTGRLEPYVKIITRGQDGLRISLGKTSFEKTPPVKML